MTRKSLKSLKQWALAIKKDIDIVEANNDWSRNKIVEDAKTYLEKRFKGDLTIGPNNKVFFRERKVGSKWKRLSA